MRPAGLRSSRRAGDAWPALLALGFAAALLALGFPRLVAALYAAPAAPVLARLDRSDPAVTPVDLLRAREALAVAQAWRPEGAGAVRLARVTLSLAAREVQAGGDPAVLVGETLAAARAGLILAPAQARGWLLMAEATLAATADPGAAVAYLLESVRASPHELGLAPNRAELGLRAWPLLDADSRDAIAGQIRLAGLRTPDILVDMAVRAGDPAPVRAALADDPDRLRRFESGYLRR